MKKIFLLLFILSLTIICNSQELVNVDYSKYLKVESFSYDKNQNKTLDDDDPLYNIDGNIIIDYKDFNTAGNILELKLDVGHDIIFEKTYKDIKFYRTEKGSKVSYVILNKYNEFLLSFIPAKNDANAYFIFIYDITFIR